MMSLDSACWWPACALGGGRVIAQIAGIVWNEAGKVPPAHRCQGCFKMPAVDPLNDGKISLADAGVTCGQLVLALLNKPMEVIEDGANQPALDLDNEVCEVAFRSDFRLC